MYFGECIIKAFDKNKEPNPANSNLVTDYNKELKVFADQYYRFQSLGRDASVLNEAARDGKHKPRSPSGRFFILSRPGPAWLGTASDLVFVPGPVQPGLQGRALGSSRKKMTVIFSPKKIKSRRRRPDRAWRAGPSDFFSQAGVPRSPVRFFFRRGRLGRVET